VVSVRILGATAFLKSLFLPYSFWRGRRANYRTDNIQEYNDQSFQFWNPYKAGSTGECNRIEGKQD